MKANRFNELKRSFKSFSFAWEGLSSAFVTQVNFKIQIIIGIFVLGFAYYFKFERWEWIILILTITTVLISEIINTVIELITTHLFPGYHETAGRIKDISAAAVLISAIAAIIIGLMLFLPKIIDFSGFFRF